LILKKRASNITAQISWIYTHDLDSTGNFYAQILGLECARDEGGARLFKTGNGAFIGLCRAFDKRAVEPEGSMISIVTDDVDAWYQRLRDNGLEVETPPHRLEQFGIYTFFVEDPNGYIIEFQQFDDSGDAGLDHHLPVT
jgi:predicted enzyme related to lactoylglutathione lyase